MGIPLSGVDAISSVLWSQRKSRIETVMISHADADHFNAVPGILDRFNVGCVLVGPNMFDDSSDAVAKLHADIADAGISSKTICKGTRLSVDQAVSCRLLHPSPFRRFQSDNENSLVLEIIYGQFRVLLPGDVERAGMHDLLLLSPEPVDVLMAPHHGSRHSSPTEFSKWSSPRFTVISAGRKSLPETEVTTRAYGNYGRVLHTHTHGAISVTIWPDDLEVDHFLKQP